MKEDTDLGVVGGNLLDRVISSTHNGIRSRLCSKRLSSRDLKRKRSGKLKSEMAGKTKIEKLKDWCWKRRRKGRVSEGGFAEKNSLSLSPGVFAPEAKHVGESHPSITTRSVPTF